MRFLLVAVLAAMLVGCGSTVPRTPPAATEPPTATPEPPPGQSDEEIHDAMRERQDFGLRADEAWVRSVAADPNSTTDLLAIPLTKAEAIEFQGRQERLSGVAGLAQRYAADHPEQFAGLFIDQQHKLVVIQFTGDIERHRAELAKLIPGEAEPLAVRLAANSKADLEALMERISSDTDWFKTVDAAFSSAGLDEMTNQVDMEISSANPAAPALILQHFGVGPAVLRIESDGTGILLQPRGKVRGRVLLANGKPPPADSSLGLDWSPDVPAPGSGACGIGDMGFGVGQDGRFELPCAPGGWTIKVFKETPNGRKLVGQGHVVVPPGLAVNVVIHLDR